MLKIVIFDSGYGGEFFADQLEAELPIVEVIRVIDWRNTEKIIKGPYSARKIAKEALRPYIGKVDLIVFANHLLSITSLKYFKRKYRNQKFLGFKLKRPDSFIKRNVLILTTRAVTRTISYYNFLIRIRRKTKTLTLDEWVSKIDDGELTEQEIKKTIGAYIRKYDGKRYEIILGCSQFNDIEPVLKKIFGHNFKIYDSFDDTIREICKTLRIRGGTGRKSS